MRALRRHHRRRILARWLERLGKQVAREPFRLKGEPLARTARKYAECRVCCQEHANVKRYWRRRADLKEKRRVLKEVKRCLSTRRK